jgi:hypothetical protein
MGWLARHGKRAEHVTRSGPSIESGFNHSFEISRRNRLRLDDSPNSETQSLPDGYAEGFNPATGEKHRNVFKESGLSSVSQS